jgi:hypothetical protein
MRSAHRSLGVEIAKAIDGRLSYMAFVSTIQVKKNHSKTDSKSADAPDAQGPCKLNFRSHGTNKAPRRYDAEGVSGSMNSE